MAENQNLLVRIDAPLGWLTVNRPEARNALTTQMWTALAAEIERLAKLDEVRVIILTGAGDKSFISGADINELSATKNNAESDVNDPRFTVALLQAITNAPKPVIAMINGHCFGGGILIAMACDLRFAAASAKFAIPAVKLGLAYPAEQGVARLARIVGATHAADILFSGRALEASEALEIGMLNRVVAADELGKTTREYALKLAEGAPLSLAAHKLALQNLLRAPALRDDEAVEQAMLRCYQSEDYAEGLAAFLEKRKPDFHGK